MMKASMKWVLPAVLLTYAYKKRYVILNTLLGNERLRKMTVQTAMNVPGVRERFISSAFNR